MRLQLTAVNDRPRQVTDLELCAVVPSGFSVVSARGTRLMKGAACATPSRLGPMSAVSVSLHLRLNRRLGSPARVQIPLRVSVGGLNVESAELSLRVSGTGHVVAPAVSAVTG